MCQVDRLANKASFLRQQGVWDKKMLILFQLSHCCGVNTFTECQNSTLFRAYLHFIIATLCLCHADGEEGGRGKVYDVGGL